MYPFLVERSEDPDVFQLSVTNFEAMVIGKIRMFSAWKKESEESEVCQWFGVSSWYQHLSKLWFLLASVLGESMPLKGVVVRLMATLTQGKNETHLSKMTKPVIFCVPPTLTVISLIHPSRPLCWVILTQRSETKVQAFYLSLIKTLKYKNYLLKSSESKRHSIQYLNQIDNGIFVVAWVVNHQNASNFATFKPKNMPSTLSQYSTLPVYFHEWHL